MKKLNTVATDSERKALGKMSKARHLHFIFLVILICVASITFLVPDDVALKMTIGVGILICLVGVSSIKLQYLQKCPRCEARIVRSQGSCAHCGLEYYSPKPSKAGEG